MKKTCSILCNYNTEDSKSFYKNGILDDFA